MLNIHFISIGGAAMHNLAISLSKKGYKITGSDDEIYEPSRSNLEKNGWGTFPTKNWKSIYEQKRKARNNLGIPWFTGDWI